MTDFIREVDEDVRQDQYKQFFGRYWPLLAGLAVLVLAGVGAWQGYDYLTTEKAQTAGGRYLAALDLARDGKTDEAVAALKDIAAGGTAGYPVLARMRLAAATGSKDPAAGAKLFDEVAADSALDPALRNVARLRAAMLLLDTDGYDDLKKRIDPLADANSPVRNPARELLALAALKAGRTDEAGKLLGAIQADPTTTGQMRQRAAALDGLVRGASKPAGSTPAATPTPAADAPPALPTSAAPAASASQAPSVAAPAAVDTPPAIATPPVAAPAEPPPSVAAPAPEAPAATAPAADAPAGQPAVATPPSGGAPADPSNPPPAAPGAAPAPAQP